MFSLLSYHFLLRSIVDWQLGASGYMALAAAGGDASARAAAVCRVERGDVLRVGSGQVAGCVGPPMEAMLL